MKRLLLVLSVAMLSSAAYAADAVVEEVAVDVVPGFTWTGGYLGAQIGYAWGDGDVTEVDGPGFVDDLNPDGWLGGVYVGYNYQLTNNVVIGAELDAAWSDVEDTGEVFDGPGDPQGATATEELKWNGALRARLGYAVDRFLPYIAGGLALGEIETTFNSPLGGDSHSDTHAGWTIGGGVDFAMTDNILLRAEYRYTDFGSETFEDADTDLTTSDVRFGIAYKF